MKIHIPNIDFSDPKRQSLFLLTRPFYTAEGWENDVKVRQRWKVTGDFSYTDRIQTANVFFIPHPVNTYNKKQLQQFNALCLQYNIKGYGYISGDYGIQCPEFSQLTFFRMGGFKSQLSSNNRGFPVIIPDSCEKIYSTPEVELRKKQELPVVGFCGHAHFSFWKQLKEKGVFIRENIKRFIINPLRKDYEPLFASGYERAQLLRDLEKSSAIKTNFIYRKHYRAGAVTWETRAATTQEYFDNIKNSDYVLCVRGAGNFSVRLYETLMMGRIPVFVNTDCLLPFEEQIDWKKHVVWVEWKDRKNIAARVAEFHNNLKGQEFEQLQLANRGLWKETLSVNAMLAFIKNSE